MLKRWNLFLKSKGDLTKQVISGGLWVSVLQVSSRLLALISKIILARILCPSDFGLFGIAMIALTAIEKFSMTGFDHALIQRKKSEREYLDCAWTIQIIRGFIIAFLLYFSAGFIASFFKSENAAPLIQLIALIQFIGSFKNIGIVYFQKELDFKREFIFQFVSSVGDFIVAVCCAIIYKNAWALIFGYMARNVLMTILSFVLHSFRPKFKIEINKIRELFSFGKWILSSSIFSFLITEGDDIIVGRLLGKASLGLYKQAYLYSNLPATQVTHIISRVTFPAYSKLQDDILKVRDAFIKVFRLNVLLSVPIAAAVFVLGPNFVHSILGDKWIPMIPAMQILAIWGAVRSIGATTGPLFRAIGKPQLVTYVQGARLVLMAAAIIPFVNNMGILGAAIVVTATGALLRPITDFIASRSIKIKYWDYLKLYIHPLLASIAASFATHYFNTWIFNGLSLISLMVGSIVFAIAYFLLLLILEPIMGMNFLKEKIERIIASVKNSS